MTRVRVVAALACGLIAWIWLWAVEPVDTPGGHLRRGRQGPSAAEEAGEQHAAATTSRPVRQGTRTPKAVVPRPRRVTQPHPAPALLPTISPPAPQRRLTTRPSRDPAAPPADTGQVGRMATGTAAPPQAEDPTAGQQAQPAAPVPAEQPPLVPQHTPVVVPPVLLTAPSSYPPEGYHMILERGQLAPLLKIEALEGRVVLRMLVRADGTVARVEIAQTSGYEALDHAAVAAARSWRFSPATRDGAPIEAWVVVPVRFVVR